MQAASLFLLATAPFAAADVVDAARAYSSPGACYDMTTHTVTCQSSYSLGSATAAAWDNTTCIDAGNLWYDRGHVHTDGCCLCDSNCDHALETSTDCDYADASAGSCKAPTGVVTCDIKSSACTGTNVYSAPSALDADGCCFCDESCDHAAETGTDCHKKIYADLSESSGSCYDSTTHVVECDVQHGSCGGYWYGPGYISSGSGCCHCDASCEHSMETGTDCTYYQDGVGHGDEYTHEPSPAPPPIDAAAATTVGILAAGAAVLL